MPVRRLILILCASALLISRAQARMMPAAWELEGHPEAVASMGIGGSPWPGIGDTDEFHSRVGKWLSEDPIGEEGGNNLYAYVGNGPVKATVPFGLETWFESGNRGDHADLVVTDPASRTGYSCISYQPKNNAGWDDWWRALYTPGELTITPSLKPENGYPIGTSPAQEADLLKNARAFQKKKSNYNPVTHNCSTVAKGLLQNSHILDSNYPPDINTPNQILNILKAQKRERLRDETQLMDYNAFMSTFFTP